MLRHTTGSSSTSASTTRLVTSFTAYVEHPSFSVGHTTISTSNHRFAVIDFINTWFFRDGVFFNMAIVHQVQLFHIKFTESIAVPILKRSMHFFVSIVRSPFLLNAIDP